MTNIHAWNSGSLIHGDCLEELRKMPDNCVDAIITDPPAGISFMGKEWDNFGGKSRTYDSESARNAAYDNIGKGASPFGFSSSTAKSDKKERDAFIAFMQSVMQEALRVLKPGGHALVWSLPRTSHWTATALEDAGFEIRDNIYHLYAKSDKYQQLMASMTPEQQALFSQLMEDEPMRLHIFGSGFPKSLDVSKALDKRAGAEREVVGLHPNPLTKSDTGRYQWNADGGGKTETYITAPATPAAQQYAGFGTALKPSCETWWLCRKPLAAKSVADNVLQYGTGAINIDACRVGTEKTVTISAKQKFDNTYAGGKGYAPPIVGTMQHDVAGRWPSHLLLSHSLFCGDECADDCPVRALDEQSGTSKGHRNKVSDNRSQAIRSLALAGDTQSLGVRTPDNSYGDQGGASRYFQQFYYSAKTSRAERNAGCANLPPAQTFDKNKSAVIQRRNPETGDTTYSEYTPSSNQNTHPTVKPQALMRYLVRLITPPDGVVLDCFGGSGSTALACIAEQKRFILIEREQEYVEIARSRIAYHLEEQSRIA